MENIKYYVYVSEAKVEMLYSQIPHSIRDKLEAAVKLNLRLAEISFAKKQFPDNLYTKLNLVIDCLEKTEAIGSIGKPLDYFRGCLFLGWAQIHPGVVFFGGNYNNTSVGLGGSMNNMLGYKWNPADVPTGISHTPWLVSLLSREIEMFIPFDPPTNLQGKKKDGYGLGKREYEFRIKSATYDWACDLTTRTSKFQQLAKYEFVAKKLRYSRFGDQKILLGTPIYIANIN